MNKTKTPNSQKRNALVLPIVTHFQTTWTIELINHCCFYLFYNMQGDKEMKKVNKVSYQILKEIVRNEFGKWSEKKAKKFPSLLENYGRDFKKI